ncbi:hypothetical protein CEQ36_00210 [Yersinia intermedia]|nr:hypothetical protein A6J67_23220 [Yersinia sp. FDAARGOS_228]AVL34191.1 hypothetical protein CEQ36_00210 [Yersinia intermedia]
MVVDILIAYSSKVVSDILLLCWQLVHHIDSKGRIKTTRNTLSLQLFSQCFTVGFLLLSVTFCQL